MNKLITMSELNELPIPVALCESCGEMSCAESCDIHYDDGCGNCPVQAAFTKLKEYEDTGLTPHEINRLARSNPALVSNIRKNRGNNSRQQVDNYNRDRGKQHKDKRC